MPTELPNERAIRKPGSLELDPAAEAVAIDETARLIAARKVEGSAVYDRTGRHLGAVHAVMLDKVSGQVAYVVLAFGGFLGLGESHHPLPWRALAYSTELGGYVVDIDPGALAGASGRGPGADGPGTDGLTEPSLRGRGTEPAGVDVPVAEMS